MSLRSSLAILRSPIRSSTTVFPAGSTRLLKLRTMTTQQAFYQNILVSRPDPNVQLIALNRPKALNALSSPLFTELNDALAKADNDSDIRAIVITGSDRAFAAGADIKEMKDKEYSEVFKTNFLEHWALITKIRKPIIAAVSGYALGGGCELALMCDIILCSPTAVFAQPEINLGVMTGAGGSQRLTLAVGKSRAMELMLTGRQFTAVEAEKWGVVSKIVEPVEGKGGVVEEAIQMATAIAGKPQLAVQATKEAINGVYELPLQEGLKFERRLFHGLFATKDQKEGMAAFSEKRKANFTHQ